MPHILIVDDDKRDAQLTVFALEDTLVDGHLTVARTARDAMAAIERQAPSVDLVLVDGHIDGYPATEFIQLIGIVQPTIPVVVITGSNNLAEHQRFVAVGAKRVIRKAGLDEFAANLASVRDLLP